MHLQGWPECKAGGTAAQLQLKAQRTSGPTDEWNQLTVLTVRLTSSLSHCHYRSLQGANLCLEHFRTTNSVQCRPKRMQNLTADTEFRLRHGMAAWHGSRHGNRRGNQFCRPVQHRQVQATAEEKQVRSHSRLSHIQRVSTLYQTSNVFIVPARFHVCKCSL